MLSVRSSLCRLATGPRAWSLSSVSSIGFGQGQDDGPYFQTQTQAMISLKVAIRGSDDKTHSFGPRFISSRSLKTKSYSQTVAVRNRMRAAMLRYRKPEMLQAVKMPVSMQEMDNSTLVVLSELGLHSARTEVLKRHIMSKDKVNYDKAHETYKIISAKNKENMYLLSLPYHFGILMSLTVGVFSLPMVFHLPTALWFNSNFVTADIPDIQDLETVLEVGAWTWNWMEPPLGTISFLLLTLQFSRSQLHNLGAKPYTARVKQWRGERLAQAFPQYDAKIVMDYSETSSMQATRKEIS